MLVSDNNGNYDSSSSSIETDIIIVIQMHAWIHTSVHITRLIYRWTEAYAHTHTIITDNKQLVYRLRTVITLHNFPNRPTSSGS